MSGWKNVVQGFSIKIRVFVSGDDSTRSECVFFLQKVVILNFCVFIVRKVLFRSILISDSIANLLRIHSGPLCVYVYFVESNNGFNKVFEKGSHLDNEA